MAKIMVDLNNLSEELREALLKEIQDDVDAGNDDWQLVVDHLHYSGKKRHELSENERWSVYLEADGFGYFKHDPTFLAGINDGWDWSHVRDSSDAAVKRMASKIREIKHAKQSVQKQVEQASIHEHIMADLE